MNTLSMSQVLVTFVCVAVCITVGAIADGATGGAIGIALGVGLAILVNSAIKARKLGKASRG
ncbi:MAG: hypothetical protein DLM57_05600 [Pseudonocardiales bacterium]|nr:MAG: hypothetical protein DLM57_05600 [Pseudonocardiales bacterium]